MANSDNGLVSHRGRWVFPMAGGEVTQVQVDFAFGLVIQTHDANSASIHVRISTPFEYEESGSVIIIDPEKPATLGPLLTLHKAAVKEGYAIKDGHLVLQFVDGRAIRVAPDDQYESWTVNGSLPPVVRKFSLIGLPGSGVALF